MGPQDVSRRDRRRLPRADEAPLPALRRVAGLPGLGHAARSVPALRRRRSGSATATDGGSRAAVLAASRRPEREAGPAGHRIDLDLLSLRSVPDRMEERSGDPMVSTRQSLEREPAPHGGIRSSASHRWPPRASRCLPLRSEGTWPRTSCRGCPTRLDRADARVPRELLPGRPHVRSLAGGLEVRRARVPVLPARYRTCAGGHALRRGRPGMDTLPPRPRERLGSLTDARPRS